MVSLITQSIYMEPKDSVIMRLKCSYNHLIIITSLVNANGDLGLGL